MDGEHGGTGAGPQAGFWICSSRFKVSFNHILNNKYVRKNVIINRLEILVVIFFVKIMMACRKCSPAVCQCECVSSSVIF